MNWEITKKRLLELGLFPHEFGLSQFIPENFQKVERESEKEIEDYRHRIEEVYARLCEMLEEVVSSNPDFLFDREEFDFLVSGLKAKDALDKLKRLRKSVTARQGIYDVFADLDMFKSDESEILNSIWATVEPYRLSERIDSDPVPTTKRIRLFENAVKKIKTYVSKQNVKLCKEDPMFLHHPIEVVILSNGHPIGEMSGTEAHRPMETKSNIIAHLSRVLEPYLPRVSERAKLIANIWAAFFGQSYDPRSLRKHFSSDRELDQMRKLQSRGEELRSWSEVKQEWEKSKARLE